MRYSFLMLVSVCALAACAQGQKRDYKATAACSSLGHQPGTKAYDDCVAEETASNRMEEQKREFEQRKQEEMDWKLRRY